MTGGVREPGPALSPIFVGRSRELGEIASILASSAQGGPRLVLVTGEAGIGKTRLMSEACERAEASRVIWGACLEQQRTLPYAPVAEALRAADVEFHDPILNRLFPEFEPRAGDPVADAEQERHRIAQALANFLAAEALNQPVILVLDDLHWADGATIDLLPVLTRRLEGRAVLILVGYRSDELPGRPELRAAIAELKRKRVAAELALHSLDAEQVEELVRAILAAEGPVARDLVQAIADRSDGNPFFVEELLQTLRHADGGPREDRALDPRAITEAEVPGPIQETILRRVAMLDEPARNLLRAGSVLGHRFELEPARRLSGQGEEEALEALRPLVRQQLVVEEPTSGELRFRHALTRDSVYGEMLVAERRRLHRRAAELVEETRGTETAAELALHYERAGDESRAREHALEAGGRAAGLGAVRDAHTHYASALRLTSDPAQRPGLLTALGRLSLDAGELTRSIAELREAAESAHTLGEVRAEARALLALSLALLMNGDRAGALEVRTAVLALLEPEGDSPELAAAYRALGHHHLLGSSHAEAIAWSERAVELACRVGAERVEIEASIDLGSALAITSDPDRGLELLRRGVASATERGWGAEAGRAYANLGWALGSLSRLDEAVAVAAEGVEFCERAGIEFAGILCRHGLADAHRLAGHWDEAERLLLGLMTTADERRSKKYALMALEGLGQLRAGQGRWREAGEIRDRLGPLALERDELQHVGPYLFISARVEAGTGRLDRAQAALERLRDYAEATDDAIIAPALAFACELAGDARERAPWLERLERAAAASPSPETAALLDEASGRFERAADSWAELGRPYERARALRRLGESQVDTDRDRAVAALEEANALARDLGAAHEQALAEKALRRAGVRVPRGPRATTRAAPGGLTARELEVARLIAGGATNAGIAEALVIAPKTAAAHVSHILTKLGFSSRTQVAAWFAEQETENR
jgi:ATP/maltotriose-dependent transcriptional regulator MalT